MQQPLFETESDWVLPNLNDLPDWSQAKRVGYDIETKDPQLRKLGPGVRRDGHAIGYGFAIEDGPKFYLPIRHEGGDNLPEENVLRYMRDQAKNFKGEIVGANLSYDMDYSLEDGIDFQHCDWLDVLNADVLINELHDFYNLEAVGQRWDEGGKEEVLLHEAALNYGIKKNVKGNMYKLPARFIGAYAEEDCDLPLRILRKQEAEIEKQDLHAIWRLETDVLPALLRMRRRGVKVDLDALDRMEQWSLSQEAAAVKQLQRLTGVDIGIDNSMNAEIVAHALEKVGLRPMMTAKGKPSVDATFLLGCDHEAGQMVLTARKMAKLRGTYVGGVKKHLVKDRIHCTFNQMVASDDDGVGKGVRYGRLSAGNPNLQNQPSRDEFAKEWRQIYIPDDGCQWASCDISQQEPRWTTHYAEEAGIAGGWEAGERYRNDPNACNHTMMVQIIHGEDMTAAHPMFKTYRKQGKIIYLGKCYGMGGPKLARDLGLPTATKVIKRRGEQITIEVAGDEAQAIINLFDKKVPYVKKLAQMCEKVAKQRGYIVTIGGRRCRFPAKENGNGYDWAHKALNRLIQGSGADQMKQAVVDADKQRFPLQLQVHDELTMSTPTPEYAQELAVVMANAKKGNVPFKVDVELGASWGDSME